MLNVCANVSREVADYYKGYKIDEVVNSLLDTFEFDNLPQMAGKREVELHILVQNELYESMYKLYGPRSKKVSLGRLLEFGYNMDVLSVEKFRVLKLDLAEQDPELVYLRRALRALGEATQFDKSETLTTIRETLKLYILTKSGGQNVTDTN